MRWQNSANSGDLAYAERIFQNGDDQTALNLFSKLATHNNPNAEYWLGHMYEIGLGIPRDAQKAIDLYKKAADQNVVAAEARHGDIYLSGDQVPPDFAAARSCTYLVGFPVIRIAGIETPRPRSAPTSSSPFIADML
jgi:TPR repeat protein